jgi:hypothetical protein
MESAFCDSMVEGMNSASLPLSTRPIKISFKWKKCNLLSVALPGLTKQSEHFFPGLPSSELYTSRASVSLSGFTNKLALPELRARKMRSFDEQRTGAQSSQLFCWREKIFLHMEASFSGRLVEGGPGRRRRIYRHSCETDLCHLLPWALTLGVEQVLIEAVLKDPIGQKCLSISPSSPPLFGCIGLPRLCCFAPWSIAWSDEASAFKTRGTRLAQKPAPFFRESGGKFENPNRPANHFI